MKTSRLAGIMIAGTGSGCGKTTVTCGLLKALMNRGLKTAAFKCGPDYIDPMFHTEIIGTKSRNLDSFLCGDAAVRLLFACHGENADISVIEGVMGFYDGLGKEGSHSSYSIGRLTGVPVVLVVNPKGMFLSVAAVIKGFKELKPDNNIKGVIINSVSPALYEMYRQIIEENTGLRVYGFLPPVPEAALESRHLGLVTVNEIEDIQDKLEILAGKAEECIDINGLTELSHTMQQIEYQPLELGKKYDCNIAVARDKAFCFYYEDSLDLLREMGANITFFSPLEADGLPSNIDGIILGGGYPELYANILSQNKSMLRCIKEAVKNGMPVYAECGGFMYLQQSITDISGNRHEMAGAIEGNSAMQHKLSRFGYTTLTAREDNLLCSGGGSINAHEFHYSDSDKNGSGFEARKPNTGRSWECIFTSETIFAGYPHIHFYGNTAFARSFLQKCTEYKHQICGR